MISNERMQPSHVAIIMDGSGRWALGRGLARSAGHREGLHPVRRTLHAALDLGIPVLTLHAFSSDNWRRPQREVAGLMRIFEEFFSEDLETWLRDDVRVSVFGRRDRLNPALVEAVERAEILTRGCRRLHFHLTIDYSSRQEIVAAATGLAASGDLSQRSLARRLGGGEEAHPEVDLVIRTGGEQRLSDFMLWECAYAELLFLDVLWPDFTAQDFEAAIREYARRERRFGCVPEPVAG